MKKYIFALAALFVALSSNAQEDNGTLTIYPRIGVNLSEFDGEVIYTDASETDVIKSKYKFGFTAGCDLKYRQSTYFSISIGLFYSMQGTAYDDYEDRSAGSYTKMTGMKYTMHYANMPALAIFDIGRTGFSIKAGVQVGYLLSAKFSGTSLYEPSSPSQSIPVFDSSDYSGGTATDLFNRLYSSIPVGIAYEYKHFAIDLRYEIGISKVYKGTYDKIKSRNIMLTLGYGFEL